MALTCPVCGATAKGNGDPFQSPRSVEAHISASRDDEHRGKQGKDFRDEIGDEDMSTPGAPDPGDVSDPDDMTPASDPVADGGNEASPAGGQPNGERTVTIYDVEMTHGEAIKQLAEMLSHPTDYGIASTTMVEEARDSGIPQCIECGRYMDPMLSEDVGGDFTVAHGSWLGSGDGQVVTVDEGDHLCWECDVLYKPEQDRFIYGVGSREPGAEAFPNRS